MSKSSRLFERWNPREKSSWVFWVFKKRDHELWRMLVAEHSSRKYLYKSFGEIADKVQWSDSPSKLFKFDNAKEADLFSSLRDWSNAYNDLENWINLNALVSISSNLETYLSTIIPLALSSDIGILFGTPRRIDGIEIIKHGKPKPFDFEEHIVKCTKGDWSSRLAAFEKAFIKVPKEFSEHIKELEEIRKLRNNVAHTLGRDIEASKEAQTVKALPMDKLSRTRLIKLRKQVWGIAKSIDIQLHHAHIGEYQALLFYHEIYPGLRKDLHQSERAIQLKKKIGTFGATAAGKEYCKGLVAYYEQL